MPDATTTLADLRGRVAQFVKERSWEPYHNPKDLAMALSIEASELLEVFLWRGPLPPSSLSDEDREAIRDELSDVVIYGLHLCNALQLDLSDAIVQKIAKNATKYPADRFRGRAR